MRNKDIAGPARSSRAMRREKRRQRLILQRELASFSSPQDRLELETIIAEYPVEQTRELTAILARHTA